MEYSKSSSSSTSAHSKKSSVEFSSSSEVSASSNVSSAESQIGEYRSVQNGSSSGDKVVSGVTITADEIAKGRAEIYQIDENAANAMSNGDIAQMIIAARQEGKSLRVYFNEKR
ncbi:MAG: hypothetical protein LBM27_03775 [Lactobacillaceae bacterium]|nr:hypothetical protein [Lactobacillaceae bacterium]